MQKDIDSICAYLHADITFPGDGFDDAGVSLRKFYTVMFGAEYRFTPRFSAIAQMNWVTRPFKDTGLEMLDRRIVDLLIGLSYRTKKGILIQTGGIEDIRDSCDAGADFTFFLNAGMNF